MTLTNLITYSILMFTQQGYYEGLGDPTLYYSAENTAVAGANMFSIGAIPVNPMLPSLIRGFKVTLNGKFTTFYEKRSEPVYDPFDNTVGYAVLYSRFNNYTLPGPIALAYSREKVGIGISFDSPVDYNYSYIFTDRLDAYTVVKREVVSRKGSLMRFSFILSGRIEFLHLGVSLSRANGKVEYLRTVWTPDTGTYTQSYSTDVSGNTFAFAGGLSVGYRLRMAFVYATGFNDEGNGLPRSVEFGTELRPLMRLPVRIFLRVGYDDWRSLDTVLEGRWRVHFGTTQMVFPGTSISLGAVAWRTPKKGLWTTTYAGGLHHRVLPGFHLNIAFTFTPRITSRYIDNRYLRISENLTEVMLGIRLSR